MLKVKSGKENYKNYVAQSLQAVPAAPVPVQYASNSVAP